MPSLMTLCWVALFGSVAIWSTTLTSLITYYEVRRKEFLTSQLKVAIAALPLLAGHKLTPRELIADWRGLQLIVTTVPDLPRLLASMRATLFAVIATPLILNLIPVVLAMKYPPSETLKYSEIFDFIAGASILFSVSCAVAVLVVFRRLEIAEAFGELTLWNSWKKKRAKMAKAKKRTP